MHLERLTWGRRLPSSLTIWIAFAGQSLAHKPQPMHAEKSKQGRPRYWSGNWGSLSGLMLVAGLEKLIFSTRFSIKGKRSLLTKLYHQTLVLIVEWVISMLLKPKQLSNIQPLQVGH